MSVFLQSLRPSWAWRFSRYLAVRRQRRTDYLRRMALTGFDDNASIQAERVRRSYT